MTNQAVLPVTQAELTNTDISHSIKIGKQVLLSKLAEEIEKLDVTMLTKYYMVSNALGGSFPMANTMLPKFEMEVNNCLQLSKLRLAINTFEEKDMRKNMGLVISHDLEQMTKAICDPLLTTGGYNSQPQRYRVNENFTKAIEDKFLKVSYDIGVAWRVAGQWDDDGEPAEESSHRNYHEEVVIHMDVLTKMEALLPEIEELMSGQKVMDGLRSKLSNIDKTMEQMEATLLVNELGRTDRGQQVLAVTNDLIKDVLGDSFISLSAPKV